MTKSRFIFMKVSTRQFTCIATSARDDISSLAVSGRIVRGPDSATLFRDASLNSIRRNTRTMVIDLGGVEKIDAAGIGALVFIHSTLRGAEIRLVLQNATPSVVMSLKACRLDSILPLDLKLGSEAYAGAVE